MHRSVPMTVNCSLKWAMTRRTATARASVPGGATDSPRRMSIGIIKTRANQARTSGGAICGGSARPRRDGGAERHAVQHGRVDVEVVEQLLQLLAQHLERERRLRPVGEAAAILVVRDDAKVLREKWRLVRNVRERPQRAAVDDHEHGVTLFAEVAVRGGARREVSNLVLGRFAER